MGSNDEVATPMTAAERTAGARPGPAVLPLVSVIVPVRNEEGYIGGCLRALAEQDYPRERLEVIVLDGGSTDGTEEELRRAASELGLPVRYERNPGRTTASGFNLGLDLAGGTIVIRVDGHTRIAPHFVGASVEALERTGADAVGGIIETRGNGARGEAIATALSSRFGIGDNAFRAGAGSERWTDSVPFGAYRREVFERIGVLKDIASGEDDEFNYRLRESGGRILLSPRIRSTYYCRNGFAALARQYWGYGLAKAKVLRLHRASVRWRHLVPSALVATLAAGLGLTLVDRRFAWLMAATGTAYGLAAGLAALSATGGDRRKARDVGIAYACIHLAAGAGMLAGLAREFLAVVRERISGPTA